METEESVYQWSYDGVKISDSSAPMSRALLAHRVLNGIFVFMLPAIIGATFYVGIFGRAVIYWGVWTKLSHLVVAFSVIMALKQHKVKLFIASLILNTMWAVVSLALLIIIAIDARKESYFEDDIPGSRIGVPVVLLWVLVEVLIILSGVIVLREPIRLPTPKRETGDRGNGEYQFEISDSAELAEINGDTHDDGLSNDPSSFNDIHSISSELHETLSSPTGLSRWLPFFLQFSAIFQAILWPFYFIDVIALALSGAHERQRNISILFGLTINYHYAMLIWCIGCIYVSIKFKNKRRTWFASLVGLPYLFFCFALACFKFALWTQDIYSPIITLIHIILLGPWCAAAYRIGTNYYDYSLVPTCCSCC